MNNLAVNQQTLDSREIAEMVEKDHKNLLADIRRYEDFLTGSNLSSLEFFSKSTYTDAKGEERPNYQITKKGCEFIAHKLTGQKGAEFTARYINRFHDMEQKLKQPRQLTALDELKLHYQVLETHEEKLTEIDNRIGTLENSMTIDFAQQRRLQNKAKAKAIEVLGGIESFAYHNNSTRTKVFSTIWRDYKDYFMLGSYRDTSKKEFDKAVEYIDSWKPQGKLLREIEECNNQLAFAEVAATR